jgi:hypothetical protein
VPGSLAGRSCAHLFGSLAFSDCILAGFARVPAQGRLSAAMLSSMQQLEKPRCAESQLNCFYKGRLQEKLRGLLAKNLLSASSGGYNWRQNLATNLQVAALDSYELKIAHVNSTCRDFETRCNTIEEPLQGLLAKA